MTGDDPDGGPADGASRTAPAGDDEWDSAFDETELMYPDVQTWLDNCLLMLVRRQLGGSSTWCAQWWRHAEAISRLDALWRAWETLRRDAALGMSVWWRDHADHHLTVLLSRDGGPFAACTPERHVELEPMPSTAAPEGWWGVPAEDRGPAGGDAE